MSWTEPEVMQEATTVSCDSTRSSFSAYLDGALDGRTMGRLAAHMEGCGACAQEFAAWRTLQSALGDLGPAQLPTGLQSRLRDALASEIETRRHLSPWKRFEAFWRETLVPAGLRFSAGMVATSVILGSAAWLLGSALPVQANDDRLAHMTAPRLLYTQTSTDPIVSRRGAGAVIVDAKVDAAGRVYDFDLLEGPQDAETRLHVEANLLGSVFQPATVFGVPVRGHTVMTYTTVSPGS